MDKINVAGAVHAYEDEGEGEVLLFVHGFPLDSRMWRQQIASFSKSHRVLVPDLMGFGQTPLEPPQEKLLMADYAKGLSALLDALSIREPVTLIGLSMGGYVALAFWKHFTDRLKGLGLVHTRAVADTPEGAKGRHETAAKVLKEGMGVVEGTMLPKVLAPGASPNVAKEVKEMMLATSREGAAAALRGMAERPDFRPELPKIRVPTFVLCGDHDPIAPEAEMEEMAKAIQGSRFAVIHGAGHLSPVEKPAEFNAALRGWLEA